MGSSLIWSPIKFLNSLGDSKILNDPIILNLKNELSIAKKDLAIYSSYYKKNDPLITIESDKSSVEVPST